MRGTLDLWLCIVSWVISHIVISWLLLSMLSPLIPMTSILDIRSLCHLVVESIVRSRVILSTIVGVIVVSSMVLVVSTLVIVVVVSSMIVVTFVMSMVVVILVSMPLVVIIVVALWVLFEVMSIVRSTVIVCWWLLPRW